MRVKTKIISTILALALTNSFTGCSKSSDIQQESADSNIKKDTPNTPDKKDTPDTVSVLNGTIDIGESSSLQTNSTTRAFIKMSNKNLNCGSSANVQIYDLNDIDYTAPLLKEPLEVDILSCAYSLEADKFKDPSNADSTKKYIIRTIVQDGDKKLELAATKISKGVEAPVIDPVATLLKAKFTQVIKEAQETMNELKKLGVSEEIIEESMKKIQDSFEKSFESTLSVMKEDIKSGKLVIKTEDFETEEEIDQEQTEDIIAKRKKREKSQREKAENSSAGAILEAIDNVSKQETIQRVTNSFSKEELNKKLRGKISKAIAQMKYGTIDSFVKMGLPVHDGDGNLIIFLPVDPKYKGKLPGKIFSLKYYDDSGKEAGTLGDDFAIRVINPEKDLARVNGTEVWFKEFNIDAPIIPNRVVDQLILDKDYKITMEDLGKTIDTLTGGDGLTDRLKDLYGVKLSSDIKISSEVILASYKNNLLKNNYDRAFFDRLNSIFANPSSSIVDKILQLPFIVKDGESKEAFLARITNNPKLIGYLANKLGKSLVNGIPTSDNDKNVLQFRDGFEIKPTTEVKPLTALTLVNFYMNSNSDYSSQLSFKKIPLKDEFGWIEDRSDKFANRYIWMLKDSDLQINGEGEFDNRTLDDRAKDNKNAILMLVKAVTGTNEIKIERSFDDMLKTLDISMQKIYKKIQTNIDRNIFEDEFKSVTVDFDTDMSASVRFLVQDFNQALLTNLNLTLIPIFENIKTLQRVSVPDLAIEVSSIEGDNYIYGIKDIDLKSPKSLFNKNGKEDKNGEYRATFDFELIVNDGDTKKPIATFPVFPGDNDLTYPFIYDSTVNYGAINTPSMPGVIPDIPGNFVEHYWVDFSETNMDIFFPYITTSSGDIVGENIFKFNRKTLLKLEDDQKAGKMANSSLDIVVVAKDYSDIALPSSVDSLVFGDNIKEGGLAIINLSGRELKDQTINLEVVYLDENGVELRMFKESDRPLAGSIVEVDFLRDRFKREEYFTFINGATTIDGSVDDLEFDNNIILFENRIYEFVFEDFDSITMKDLDSGEFVTFKFTKDNSQKMPTFR